MMDVSKIIHVWRQKISKISSQPINIKRRNWGNGERENHDRKDIFLREKTRERKKKSQGEEIMH